MPTPFATEADVQGLLTMLFFSALTGGNPPLFMDFRKVWEKWELEALAKRVGARCRLMKCGRRRAWWTATTPAARPLIGQPGRVRASRKSCPWVMPLKSRYFRAGQFGDVGFAGWLDWHRGTIDVQQFFRFVWVELGRSDDGRVPDHLAQVLCQATNRGWPRTFIVPKYATMYKYKHYPPANHVHMVQGLSPAQLGTGWT